MNNLTSEQIQAILDGAPIGATHVGCDGDLWKIRKGKAEVLINEDWYRSKPCEPLNSLSDLREILSLRQEVERYSLKLKK